MKLQYSLIQKEGKIAIIEQIGSMRFWLAEGFNTTKEAQEWLENYHKEKDKEMQEKADNFWKSLKGDK